MSNKKYADRTTNVKIDSPFDDYKITNKDLKRWMREMASESRKRPYESVVTKLK